MVSSWFLHGFFHMFEKISTSSNNFQFPTQAVHPWHHGNQAGNHARSGKSLEPLDSDGRISCLKSRYQNLRKTDVATWKLPMKNGKSSNMWEIYGNITWNMI
jgi:hypothetical protein